MAAAREGKAIDFAALLQFCRGVCPGAAGIALLDGAGGTTRGAI